MSLIQITVALKGVNRNFRRSSCSYKAFDLEFKKEFTLVLFKIKAFIHARNSRSILQCFLLSIISLFFRNDLTHTQLNINIMTIYIAGD